MKKKLKTVVIAAVMVAAMSITAFASTYSTMRESVGGPGFDDAEAAEAYVEEDALTEAEAEEEAGPLAVTWSFDESVGRYTFDDCAYKATWVYAYNAERTKAAWYHLDAYGYLNNEWFYDLDGNEYFLYPEDYADCGAMVTGWVNIDGFYHYLNDGNVEGLPLGALVKNVDFGNGYALNSNGVLELDGETVD